MLKRDVPKAVTDLLGIPAVDGIDGPWLSNENTVIKEWFQAVAELLGLPYTGKVTTMAAILGHYGIPWDADRYSSTQAPAGGGGNVRKEAFEDLLRAIALDPRSPSLAAVAAGTPFDADETARESEDARILRAIRTRRGQPRFRQLLLDAYDGRCALTGTDAPAALEAAHIRQHSDGGSYETSNGILLRADLHTLFDLGLLGVDPSSGRALLHAELVGSAYEAELATATLRLPANADSRPNPQALAERNRRFGLA